MKRGRPRKGYESMTVGQGFGMLRLGFFVMLFGVVTKGSDYHKYVAHGQRPFLGEPPDYAEVVAVAVIAAALFIIASSAFVVWWKRTYWDPIPGF